MIVIGINLVRRYETGLKLHIRRPLDAEAAEKEILETVVTDLQPREQPAQI